MTRHLEALFPGLDRRIARRRAVAEEEVGFGRLRPMDPRRRLLGPRGLRRRLPKRDHLSRFARGGKALR